MSTPTKWSDFWQERWEKNAIGFHQADVEGLLIKYLPNLSTQFEILVPLCGKSKDILFFSERGFQVIGIELSHIACEAFFKENQLAFTVETLNQFTLYQSEKIKIYCGDFFYFRPDFLKNLGLVYDRAALIALPPELRKRYSAHLTELIQNQRQNRPSVLIIAIAYDSSLKQGPPFSVTSEEIHALYGKAFSVNCLESEPDRLGELEITESVYRLNVF